MNAKAVSVFAVAVLLTATAFAQQSSSPTRSRRNGARTHDAQSPDRPATTQTVLTSSEAGDFQTQASAGIRVGYFVDKARSWFDSSGGALSWKEPGPAETNHIGVVVRHAGNDRILPYAKVSASLADESGKDVVSTTSLSFTWAEDSPYYGTNVVIPDTTQPLALNVRIEPPEFRRLDKTAGAFFPTAAAFSFRDVIIRERTKHADQPTTESDRGLILEGRHPAVTPTPYPGSKQAPASARD